MSKFDTKEDLLVSIQLLFNNMKIGKLSEEDMKTLVSSTRELYERALILRYKAYEHKIYGDVVETNQEPVIPNLVHEHIVVEPEIPVVKTIVEESIPEAKEPDTPSFDMSFSLFDQLEEPNDTKVEHETLGSESDFQEPIQEEDTFVPNETVENIEFAQTPVVEEIQIPVLESTSTPKDLFDKMLEQNNSLGSKLMFTKIDSLQSAFGLNEKLQIIREMFNGSSEAFTQAIQIFDMQPDFTHAKTILSNFTLEYSWELDTPIVIEFVQKIARRYV